MFVPTYSRFADFVDHSMLTRHRPIQMDFQIKPYVIWIGLLFEAEFNKDSKYICV